MGGLSPERNVSLSSGSLIAAALAKRGHRVLPLDLYAGIENDTQNLDELFTLTPIEGKTVPSGLPDIDALVREHGGRTDEIGPRVIDACRAADCTFLALHGGIGENGQLQAALDAHAIPYTGSGSIGSMQAMDKDIAKKILRSHGVLTPDWVKVDATEPFDVSDIIAVTGLPAVVKPCSGGSSVGVIIVDTAEQLGDAITEAARYERFVMVEQRIGGRELTCAFFDGAALPPVEIIPKTGFYDYKNKYQPNATVEICPAPIGEEATQQVYRATEQGFEALGLRSYARFDYILDEQGRAWCLEANTLPGMTPTSLLPQEAAAVGIEYGELCEKIALLALEK
jgi:D-alanine-D-alanine ligase